MTGTRRRGGFRAAAVRAATVSFTAQEQLAGGIGTALLALAVLGWLLLVAVACLVGVGVLAVPVSLRLLRATANRERARLSRWGPELYPPGPAPRTLRSAVVDPTVRRELAWLVRHATIGGLIGLVGVLVPISAVRELTFPLWWWVIPDGMATPAISLWTVTDWPGAFGVWLTGFGWAAVQVGLVPGLARLQSRPGRRLLAAEDGADLSLRVAELTATRAAALDAHAAELRRIERALHDGSQNRLVTATVLLGAARRAVAREPATADALLERAQQAAELALADLRAVARSILPPVLADRGLAGALSGLAAASPVPCEVDVDVPGRCAASVEATAYFVVAEALTNVAKHSGASRAGVLVRRAGDRLRVEVTDDGVGGADESGGSGLAGVRGRIEAHDGTLTMSSPVGGPTRVLVELPCGL